MPATLPLQGASYQEYYSLARDTHLRTVLEDGFNALHGRGVLAKGRISKTAAYAIEVETATQFFAEGKRLTLGAAAAYTATEGAGLVYVWGKIARTAAAQATLAALDTYALAITHTLVNTAPSEDHFPLAILTLDGSGIVSWDDEPPGKRVRALAAPLVLQRDYIAAAEVQEIPAGQQVHLFDELTIAGELVLGGNLRIS